MICTLDLYIYIYIIYVHLHYIIYIILYIYIIYVYICIIYVHVPVLNMFSSFINSLKTGKLGIFIFRTTVRFLQIRLETSRNTCILNVHAPDSLFC